MDYNLVKISQHFENPDEIFNVKGKKAVLIL